MLKLVTLVSLLFFILISPDITTAQLNQKQEDRLKELEKNEKAWKEWKIKNVEKATDIKDFDKKIPPEAGKKEKKMPQPDVSEYETGRFQAIRMDNNAIFLLDTKEGHIWVWVTQKDSNGIPSEFLFYQGMLIPGRNMGDLIDRTYKKMNQEK